MAWPDICVEDNTSCPNEWPTLFYQQLTCGKQTVCVKDRKGCPIDLTNKRVCLLISDVPGSTGIQYGGEGEVVEGEEGSVCFEFEAAVLKVPGLFPAEIQVYETELCEESSCPEEESSSGEELVATPTKLIYRARAFVEVATNLEDLGQVRYPITIAEVRLAIRDKCPLDNFLLDNVQFTNTEIAWAMRRPVEWFNETPPNFRVTYSPANFPWRYNHLNGTVAELLIMVAGMNEERNRLTYSAAGLSVGDKDHGKAYMQIGQQMKAEYQKWGLGKKKAMNMEMAFQRTQIRSFGNAFSSSSGSNFNIIGDLS
jgi:hypothetical protein